MENSNNITSLEYRNPYTVLNRLIEQQESFRALLLTEKVITYYTFLTKKANAIYTYVIIVKRCNTIAICYMPSEYKIKKKRKSFFPPSGYDVIFIFIPV